MTDHILLHQLPPRPDYTAAGNLRNKTAFTSKDMGHEFDSAFAYGIILGWDQESYVELRNTHGWDNELIQFMQDSHERFKTLADKKDSR